MTIDYTKQRPAVPSRIDYRHHSRARQPAPAFNPVTAARILQRGETINLSELARLRPST